MFYVYGIMDLNRNDDGIYVKGLIYIRMFIYNTLYIIFIESKEAAI